MLRLAWRPPAVSLTRALATAQRIEEKRAPQARPVITEEEAPPADAPLAQQPSAPRQEPPPTDDDYVVPKEVAGTVEVLQTNNPGSDVIEHPVHAAMREYLGDNPFIEAPRPAYIAGAVPLYGGFVYTRVLPLPPVQAPVWQTAIAAPGFEQPNVDTPLMSRSSKTVVVILGWLGATREALKRVADLYTQYGIDTIAYTPSMESGLRASVAMDQAQVLRHHLAFVRGNYLPLPSAGAPGDPLKVVFHLFSSNGLRQYASFLQTPFDEHGVGTHKYNDQAVSDAIRNVKTRVFTGSFRVTGAILDSAPVPLTRENYTNGYMHAVARTYKWRVGSKQESRLAYYATSAFFSAYLRRPQMQQAADAMNSALHAQPRVPLLYMYSGADRVAPQSVVEAAVAEQRAQGFDVTVKKWPSSGHVSHAFKYPNQYIETVTEFLRHRVLKL